MKKLIVISLLTMIFFVACNDQNSITSPDSASSPQWVELNTNSMSKIEADYVEKRINGNKGGLILFRYGYLYIPRKSFDGNEVLSVSNDRELAYLDFGPEMEFDKDLHLSVIYNNLDLTGIDPASIKFGYMNNGQFEESDYSRLVVNVNAGILAVYGAKLNHFSRYGFLR
jgi:hypothetical protein